MKTLVVAGASMGVSSCGGESRRHYDGASGMAGTGGTAGTTAGTGTPGGGMAGSAGQAPVITGDVSDCPPPQQVCSCTYEPGAGIQWCTLLHPLGYFEYSGGSRVLSMHCTCDRTRPAAPEACEYTQQFNCTQYSPAYEACVCDPGAPRSPADCPDRHPFLCDVDDPMIGCRCITPIK